MKNIKKILTLIIGIFALSCNDLDIPPLSLLIDNQVLSNKEGVNAYLTRLYSDLPIEDFTYNKTAGFNQGFGFYGLGKNTGEYLGCDYNYDWSISSGFGYWPYASIKNVNYIIENLPNFKDNFQEDEYNQFLGEAYFIRAYYYFALVKRYGGIPIIKEVQKYPQEDMNVYKVSRNKEDEVYEFIREDLDKAMELMKPTSPKGKANKYVAATLKSRAMLYAGTIAKYGNVQLDGLLGVPKEKAVEYFKQSYNAAKMVQNGGYQLYRGNSDKVQNYVDIFFDAGSSENIFIKQYSRVDNRSVHWEIFMVPAQLKGPSGYGSALNPTIEFVELFGELPIVNGITPIRYDKVEDILDQIEPRLRAVVMFPGETWMNQKIDVLGGVYESYPNGILHKETSTDVLWNGMRLTGLSGTGPRETTKTGFFLRKYLNYKASSTAQFNWGMKEDPWIDMRFAEVLLNKAEAACELTAEGQQDEEYLNVAMEAINDLRERAGAALITNASQLQDINVVRLERRKELAFENHTWWDIRRWRRAHLDIDHVRYKAFAPYYVYDEKKYIFLKSQHEKDGEFTFDMKFYYEALPQGEINKNQNLLPQNPLW